jgi:hypothetical protein
MGGSEGAMPLKPEVRRAIFGSLKGALVKQCPPMVCSKDTAVCYEIIGNTPVPYGSTKKIVPGMYFASVVARKDMVSFYFMPIYFHREEYVDIAPTLLGSLKGKACFNFRNADQIDKKELDSVLKKGARAWKKLGYIK